MPNGASSFSNGLPGGGIERSTHPSGWKARVEDGSTAGPSGKQSGNQFGSIRPKRPTGSAQGHCTRIGDRRLCARAGWLSADRERRRDGRISPHGMSECRSGTEPIRSGEICARPIGRVHLPRPFGQQIRHHAESQSWPLPVLRAGDARCDPARVRFGWVPSIEGSWTCIVGTLRAFGPASSCDLPCWRILWISLQDVGFVGCVPHCGPPFRFRAPPWRPLPRVSMPLQ